MADGARPRAEGADSELVIRGITVSSRDVSRRAFVASAVAAPFVLRFGALRPSQERVIVVGAGAFGGWTALSLRRAGARVTLVDAWGAGNSRASSGGETRVIRG